MLAFHSLPFSAPLLLLLSFLLPSSALILHSSNGLLDFPSPPFSSSSVNLTAPLILSSPIDACSPLSLSPSSILFIDPSGCPLSIKLHHCLLADCIGAVLPSSSLLPGLESFQSSLIPSVPVVFIGRDHATSLKSHLSSSPLITLSSADSSHNVWYEAFHSVAFFTLFETLLALFHSFVCLLSLRKIWQYWGKSSSSSFLPLLTCSLILSSSLLILLNLIDPFGARHILSSSLRRFLLFASLPLTFSHLSLILLYINAALTGRAAGGWIGQSTGRAWSLSFLTFCLFDVLIAYADIEEQQPNRRIQAVYAGLAVMLSTIVVWVGLVAGRRMWHEERRRSHLTSEREEGRKQKLDDIEPVLMPIEVPDMPSMVLKYRTQSASPSMYGQSVILTPTALSLPDLAMVRVDSFPSTWMSQQGGLGVVEESVEGQYTLMEVEKDEMNESLLQSSSTPSGWSLVMRLYSIPRMFRLIRFVILSFCFLILLSFLLLWQPIDSPLYFITRQGLLFAAVGCLGATSIAVF